MNSKKIPPRRNVANFLVAAGLTVFMAYVYLRILSYIIGSPPLEMFRVLLTMPKIGILLIFGGMVLRLVWLDTTTDDGSEEHF